MNIDIVSMLTGAVLVMLGVLAAGVSDRIRGITASGRELPEARAKRPRPRLAVVEAPEPASARPPLRTVADDAMDRDATSALVNLGYSKVAARAAVEGCEGSQRGTLESLVRAAIKRADAGERKAVAHG